VGVEAGATLPLPTQMLIGMSHVLLRYGWLMALLLLEKDWNQLHGAGAGSGGLWLVWTPASPSLAQWTWHLAGGDGKDRGR